MKLGRSLSVLFALLFALPHCVGAQGDSRIVLSDLSVKGRIEGENIVFVLEFDADVKQRNVSIPLAVGDLALYGASVLPVRSKLTREGESFLLKFESSGKQHVSFQFASRPVKEDEWRHTGFSIPVSNIRRLLVECDRDDLEIRFPGALSVERGKNQEGKTEVTAFLGLGDKFEVRWKPEVKKLAAEAAVECQANTTAIAGVGAMRLNTIFTYRIVQGELSALRLAIPANASVTQVRGADIREWALEKKEGEEQILTVSLSRPKEAVYKLQVESETALPQFPCDISLPVIAPRDVIRTSGFLMTGADSAIKLLVKQSPGLTQVDQMSFPKDIMEGESAPRLLPSRSVFTYQYANMPYTLELAADDIVSEYGVDDRMVLSLADNDLVFSASVEIDVRDTGTRDMTIETDPAWIVANVAGTDVSDYDIREENGKRTVTVYFRQAVMGRILLDVRLERTLGDAEASLSVPVFKVRGAKTERGYLVLAAEKGLRLRAGKASGMHEVHTGSVPMNVGGAQQAFRFKEGEWALTVHVDRTAPGIHAEIFHLVSLGEGVLYGSSTITYHISGSPVRSFVVWIPGEYRNIEFTGRDIRNWIRDGDKWTVYLQEKVIDDYTLLASYDRPFDYTGGETTIGGVCVEGAETEMGYVALASSADLNISESAVDKTIIRIDPDEIPSAYKPIISDRVLKAYKYVKTPHTAKLAVKRFPTSRLLSQVVDHGTLVTSVTADGDIVTTATYSAKNSSEQYLVVRLPEGVMKCWSTRVTDEEGNMEAVPSRRQRAADGRTEVLVPLRRPRDPNATMKVEIVYPESRKLGALGGRVALRAPTMPATHATFVRWTVEVPADRVITSSSGNMQADPAVSAYARRIGDASILFRAVPTILAAPFRWLAGGNVARSIKRAVRYGEDNVYSKASFTETMALTDSTPLTLDIRIAPLWVGPGGSLVRMAGVLALGVVSTSFALRRRRQSRWFVALGATVCVFGLAQVAAGRLVTAGVLSVIAGIAILWALALVTPWMFRLARSVMPAAGRVCAFLLTLPLRIVAAPFRVAWSALHRARKGRAERMEEGDVRPAAGPPPFEAEPEAGGGQAGGEPAETASAVEQEPPAPDAPPAAGPGDDPGKGGDGGHASPALLAAVFAIGLGAVASFAGGDRGQQPAGVPADAPPAVLMDSVGIKISGPGSGRDEERSATVEKTLEFETDGPVSFMVVEAPGVLTDYELGTRYASIRSDSGGYSLNIERKGRYKILLHYIIRVGETGGLWSFNVPVPENMKNVVALDLPETGMEISCAEAVHFSKTETENATRAVAVIGSSRNACFSWKPRIRKAKLEKAVYFCEINSIASFEPGVVDATHLIKFQVAQGELKRILISVPDRMSITAVSAPGLSTWRFDPEKKLLEAVLEKAIADDFVLTVASQIGSDALADAGYTADIGALDVDGAVRLRGSLAIASPETMQVRVESSDGLHAMNVADFSPAALAASAAPPRKESARTIKRAFRYDKLPVKAVVQAQPVLPEIRVEQTTASLSVADERIVLSTQMKVIVSKAGVFSLRLDIPRDFDIETLTGEDVSHWDEIESKDERVVIHFRNQVLGARTLNLVIARMEKGIEESIEVPRITVIGARKHSGTLVVSGERGVRMTTVKKEGVSELSPERDLNMREQGLLAFKLLRPAWQITLATEVIAPSISPEALHRVDLTEGMLRGQVRIVYKIENAGCKTFFLKAPQPGTVLAISGEQIAKCDEVDRTNGIWRVDLHNKVLNSYELEATYQLPFDPKSQRAVINAVETLDTNPAKGYLVVLSSGRVQVKPGGDLGGFKPEDSRAIPTSLSSSDMSDAILCYRVARPDYSLELSVVRHEAAEVLQARISEVVMSSVAADNRGSMLTRVSLKMDVGDLGFLSIWLPGADDMLWTVFVNGKATDPARDGDAYRVPLEESVSDEITTVDFLYAGAISKGMMGVRDYRGPRFNLPLNDITWNFFVEPEREYYGFGGTMKHIASAAVSTFSVDSYESYNKAQMSWNRSKAKTGLDKGEEYAQKGDPTKAKKALAEAMVFAQGQADREDARIQYQNMVKQQALVGLVQRRNVMRLNQNIRDERQMEQLRGFNDGNFTTDYARSVEQSLTLEENEALNAVTEKIIEQQAAAAGVAQAIKITLPEHGRKIEFFRPIQINPKAPVTVRYLTADTRAFAGIWGNILPAFLLLALLRIAVGRLSGTAD